MHPGCATARCKPCNHRVAHDGSTRWVNAKHDPEQTAAQPELYAEQKAFTGGDEPVPVKSIMHEECIQRPEYYAASGYQPPDLSLQIHNCAEKSRLETLDRDRATGAGSAKDQGLLLRRIVVSAYPSLVFD